MPQSLSVTMSSRAVVAVGHPFLPWGEPLSDLGVALDEIASLRPTSEAVVLCVKASGGTEDERAAVEGEWLCEADGSEPSWVPSPKWLYGNEALTWASSRTWREAWETCGWAHWMLYAALATGVDRRRVVLAVCACARTALHHVPDQERRPRLALEAAEAWARGAGPLRPVAEFARAGVGADGLRGSAEDAAIAAHMATVVARIGSYMSAADAAFCAAMANARHPVDVSMQPDESRRDAHLRDMACLVRGEVGTIEVMRASIARAAAEAQQARPAARPPRTP